jgi:hypothetical protein
MTRDLMGVSVRSHSRNSGEKLWKRYL